MVIILDCVQNHAKDLDALWLFGDSWVLTQTHMYVCMYACMYNPDCLHRICTFSTLRVSTEKKKLRIFGVEIVGVEFWSAQPEPKQIP